MDSRQRQGRPADEGRARTMMTWLIGGALATWLVAALLVFALVPLLLADPALAPVFVEVAPLPVFGTVAAMGALAGVLVLASLVIVRRAPARAVGRWFLLAGGIAAAFTGLQLLNLGFVDLGWGGAAAAVGLLAATIDVAVGLLAAFGSLTRRLPGPTLDERLRGPDTAPPAAATRARMGPLTVVFVAAWVVVMAWTLLGQTPLPFMLMQFGMPVLAGAVVAGWREGRPDHLATLGLGSLAGMVASGLFFAVMATPYFHFNAAGFALWWVMMGALLGPLGYPLWRSFPRGGARWQPRPG